MGAAGVTQDFFSIEDVASILKLHVKTVRKYVRDGKLPATRIGKQYRIARADLLSFTGQSIDQLLGQPVRRGRHVEFSGVVQIDAVSRSFADRITTMIMAVANSCGGQGPPLKVETIYDEERASLKVVMIGDFQASRQMLDLLDHFLDNEKKE